MMTRRLQFWFGERMQWQLTWEADCVELVTGNLTSQISRHVAGNLLRAAYRIDRPDAYFRESVTS
jgi:hypothetical protein